MASNAGAATPRSNPFFRPLHPISCTIFTSWPGNSRLSFFGKHSSSRIRIAKLD